MNNIEYFLKDKEELALFVGDLLLTLKQDWQWITTIVPVKSGGYCVLIAIDTSLEDDVKDWVRDSYGLLQII